MSFLGTLKSDFRRAVFSWHFLFSALLVAVVYISSGYYEFNYNFKNNYDVATMFNFLHNVGTYVTMIILSSTFCYSSSFCTDWQEKSIFPYAIRSGQKNYCCSKVLSCAFAGGIAPVLGLLLFIISLSFFFPLLDERGGLFGSAIDQINGTTSYACLMPVVISKNGPLYFFLLLYLVFLVCAFWAVVGLTVSAIVPNKFVAIFSPYLIFFLESLFLRNTPLLKTSSIMVGNFNFGLGVFGNICFVTLIIGFLIFLLGVFFTYMVKRKLANETV